MSTFGQILKALRTSKNLSQQALASKFNTTQTTIYAWEKGKQEPDMDTTIKLAQFFDVSTDYLLGLEEYDYTRTSAAPTITSREAGILAKLRSLPPEALAAVNGYLDGLAARITPDKRNKKYSD